MEGLTRLVSESLARHGFDRPLDYRRLRWSRWFRCDSHHSLLSVPSKPGVFAVAEEIMDFGSDVAEQRFSAIPKVAEQRFSAIPNVAEQRFSAIPNVAEQRSSAMPNVEERRFSAASGGQNSPALAAAGTSPEAESRKPEAAQPRRMLAVTQFFEDDDMAFVLDRMLSRQNPMAARLASGRYFVRFVVIEDQAQRRSICSALNQWMVSAAEKATGIGAHFATSLELTPATEYNPQADERQQSLFPNPDTNREEHPMANREGHDFSRADSASQISPALAAEGLTCATDAHVARTLLSATAVIATLQAQASAPSVTAPRSAAAPHLHSGAATNIHCPSPFPSGF